LNFRPWGGFVHVDPENSNPEDVKAAQRAWQLCKEKILSGRYFMVVLDEICNAIAYGLLDVDEVVEVLKKRPPELHVVLTGRGAHPKLLDRVLTFAARLRKPGWG